MYEDYVRGWNEREVVARVGDINSIGEGEGDADGNKESAGEGEEVFEGFRIGEGRLRGCLIGRSAINVVGWVF